MFKLRALHFWTGLRKQDATIVYKIVIDNASSQIVFQVWDLNNVIREEAITEFNKELGRILTSSSAVGPGGIYKTKQWFMEAVKVFMRSFRETPTMPVIQT